MSVHQAVATPVHWFRALGGLGVLLVCLVLSSSPLRVDDPLRLSPSLTVEERINRFIAGYAKQYRLEPALLRAVIKVESGFNPTAVSPKGARGLMQLMPPTAAALNVLDPFDPGENIRAGAGELRRLLDRFGGNLKLALAAYHAGETRVSRSISVPPFPSTKRYIREVLRYYHLFMDEDEKAP
ncbi:MAG TPA: lytic transglycosylase domain-containing protein [Nitrospiraceae bacterium]|nr:lytic transglycosylase domain-containing protein [Nitrospiraceae bacterium]